MSKREEPTPVGWSSVSSDVRGLATAINPPTPNPAPLGLYGFGLTTALLQIVHTRISGSSAADAAGTEAWVLGFAMFFGGLAQLLAGLGEVKRNNLFGYTAFVMYGGFWMSVSLVIAINMLQNDGIVPNAKAAESMLFLMGIPTVVLFICTFKKNATLSLLFGLLVATFFLLMAGVRHETVDKVAGYFGLATAAVAYWLASAELINDIVGEGKEIIPLGHWRRPTPHAKETALDVDSGDF
jgi:succinate-acetate transporter protein